MGVGEGVEMKGEGGGNGGNGMDVMDGWGERRGGGVDNLNT